MALNWPTFFTRLGSAIVFCIVMMAGLLWNIVAFTVLVSLIQYLCLREYFRLIKKIDPEINWPGWLMMLLQIGSLGLLWFGLWDIPKFEGRMMGFVFLIIPTTIILIAFLSKGNAWKTGMYALGSIFYITMPMLALTGLHSICMVLPIALILMIWMNDTMAYLVGSFIGKTPFSAISPKKTWEGTAGGAILTLAGAAVWGYYSPIYHMVDWMALALCAAIAGTAGDLLESKLKRMADVKDSGTMMPGHGGALDRFDSLLVAVPFAFCYAYLFMPDIFWKIF
ncbi:MAG: phosphatidate cytidylyltransferase [Bacteroidetes bacterium]|nr:phosphatidate cytidylyltransferase [Bacteroidota bacterium]